MHLDANMQQHDTKIHITIYVFKNVNKFNQNYYKSNVEEYAFEKKSGPYTFCLYNVTIYNSKF